MTQVVDRWAGERYRSRNRKTHTLVVLVDADEQGIGSDGKWALICDEHGSSVNGDNQTELRTFLGAPWVWCEACGELVP